MDGSPGLSMDFNGFSDIQERGQLFEQAPIALFCLDEPGRILSANHAMARLLARSVSDMKDRPFITMVAKEHRRRVMTHLAQVAAGSLLELDITLEMPRGTPLPVTLVSTPVYSEGGAMCCSNNAILDVSRRYQAERTLKKAKERLDHIAHHDALTGLANRYLFEDRLARATARCRRNGWLGALVFVDIDRFKTFNDTYGHDVGDAILVEAATRLTMAVREEDTVCRYSGDEFLLILENVTSTADVDMILNKLKEEFTRPVYGVADRPLQLTASFGATLFDKSSQDIDVLVKQADLAMYEVKQSRSDVVAFYSSTMESAVARKRELEGELDIALGERQFRLDYQPQVSFTSGRVTGCEALLRWDHPVRGLIEPNEFVAIAENAGLTEGISRWVLTESCKQARRWLDDGCSFDRIAVNVSPRDVSCDGLVENVKAALSASGLPASMLEIEVTETSVMHHPSTALKALRELSALGVRIALDDFGTGYSSLKCLKDYPFDRIKIDQSFVSDLEVSGDASAIVLAMVAMAASLGIDVIAEGVETRAQQEQLFEAGVDLMQGFLFSRPLTPEEFLRFSATAG